MTSFPLKVRLLSVVFLLAFALITLRLVFLQLIARESYSAAADRQHFYSLSLPARRGEIKSVDGAALAADRTAFLLYAHLPDLPADKTDVAKKLAVILAQKAPFVATSSGEITQKEQESFSKQTQEQLEKNLSDRLNYKNALWVNLAHFLDGDTRKQVEDLHFSGLGFVDEEARDYPEASMAAHILGFVGSDPSGNPKGFFGLEGFYDRELAGRPGELRVERDAFGRPIAIGAELRQDKRDGHDLKTTINRAVQFFVEKNLSRGIADWKASGGTAIVMDPNDGAVIAMASFPNYEPARYSYYQTNRYKNPAVADLYEPGSIIKPLIVAAALNEGKITPETKCDRCDGPRQIGDYTIHTFNDKYHPNSTITEVLINSDNTGMVMVGEKLGFSKLYSYLARYGFGQKTGVDLQEEEEGALRKINEYYPIDQATMTFGQGIGVNALQIMRAWSTLANGGYLITPHFVTEIVSDNEKIPLNFPRGEKVLKGETTKVISEMLVRVANESPEHFPKDNIPFLGNYRIAAKSGTAQIAVGGKYKSQGTVASVIGFFPADKPKFLVMVKLDEPEVRPWGSDTAGPVFFSILRDLIQYYGISP